MIAGHYATALIAHQRFPKGSLLFFLIASQLQDILWFLFHYMGLEPTTPNDVFDATLSNMAVIMVYSHHAAPQFLWGILMFIIGKVLFKSTTVGLAALTLVIGHFFLDLLSGHPHYFFGEDSTPVGLGLYANHAYLAILIEALFVIGALWYYFRNDAAAGNIRTRKNRATIIGLFAYGIIFMLSIATVSFRQWLNIPVFDLAFSTTMPMIILTYIIMAICLYRAALQVKKP